MGLIEIRNRSERLGNLGGVREADVRTGAAGVLAGMADAAAQDGRSERALAGAVPGLLDGAKKLALEFAAAQERRDQEAADRYVARFRQGMDAYNNGSVDAQGNRVRGAMEADFDDSGTWLEGNVQYRDWFGAELGKELKMSDRAMEIARKRLVGYDLHMQNRWQGRAAQMDDLRARAAADENLAAARGTLLDCAVDGDTNELGADWALALDGYGEAVERALDAAHVPAEARPEARRRAALQICRDALARRLSRASEEALAPAAPTEESVRDAFGGLERSVASDGWEGVFPFGAAARTADGRTVADPLRAHLDGADLAAFRSAALTDIKSARSRALHEADARRREAREKTVRASVEKELSFRDLPPERWADAYEALGRDEALKRADPARAMRCLDAAREMREAERRAGAGAAKVKSNEENLARSLATLDLLKMEGSLSQDDANEAQAAIWRRFRALSLGGQLSPSFMRSFVTRISGQLSDQEANAMRRFYQAFGYQGGLSAQGEVTAAERKSNAGTDYYAPREAGDRHSDNYFRIPADELFRYGDSLLRTLRALGPDMNREGVVEKEIARMKKDWRKGQFDKNREASVRSVMDMQREARTRWEAAQPDKRSDEDDRRREDGNPAK